MYIAINEERFVIWCGEDPTGEVPEGSMVILMDDITEPLQIRDRIGWVWRMTEQGRLVLPKDSERVIGEDRWMMDDEEGTPIVPGQTLPERVETLEQMIGLILSGETE